MKIIRIDNPEQAPLYVCCNCDESSDSLEVAVMTEIRFKEGSQIHICDRCLKDLVALLIRAFSDYSKTLDIFSKLPTGGLR